MWSNTVYLINLLHLLQVSFSYIWTRWFPVCHQTNLSSTFMTLSLSFLLWLWPAEDNQRYGDSYSQQFFSLLLNDGLMGWSGGVAALLYFYLLLFF